MKDYHINIFYSEEDGGGVLGYRATAGKGGGYHEYHMSHAHLLEMID